MSAEKVWHRLIVESLNQPIPLKTKSGLNFNLVSDGKVLKVTKSDIEPSCKLKDSRAINKSNFIKVFPYNTRWTENEKGIGKEIATITLNSVYIMAAIGYSQENMQ